MIDYSIRYNKATHTLPYSVDASGPVKRIVISELPRELADADEELEGFGEGAAETSEEESQEMISSKDKMIKAKVTKTTKTKASGSTTRGRGSKRGRGK